MSRKMYLKTSSPGCPSTPQPIYFEIQNISATCPKTKRLLIYLSRVRVPEGALRSAGFADWELRGRCFFCAWKSQCLYGFEGSWKNKKGLIYNFFAFKIFFKDYQKGTRLMHFRMIKIVIKMLYQVAMSIIDIIEECKKKWNILVFP